MMDDLKALAAFEYYQTFGANEDHKANVDDERPNPDKSKTIRSACKDGSDHPG